jgi:RecA-family ATPase
MSLTGAALGTLAYETWGIHGVAVFPCGDDKRPLTTHGHNDAKTDKDGIVSLFRSAGQRATHIGAAMGEACGLFAVDFDTYKDGASDYKNTLLAAGVLPPTRIHNTKNGGEHYIYSVPDGTPVPRNSVPHRGVEIRGEGGYIIMPPSPGYSIIASATIDAPEALINRLGRADTAFKASSTSELEQHVLDGSNFHEALNMIAAKRHGAGESPITIQTDMIALMNASVASSPSNKRHDRWASVMNGNELGRICSSAYKKFNPKKGEYKLAEVLAEQMMSHKGDATGGFFTDITSDRAFGTEKKAQDTTVETFAEGDFPFSKSYSAAEVNDQENKQYLLFPLIMESDVMVLSAPPKAGKTLLSMTLCLHMAAGIPLSEDRLIPLDAKGNIAKIPVVYFALEGQGAIRKRIKAWLKYYNGKFGSEFTQDDLQLYVVERGTNLADAAVRQDTVDKLAIANAQFKARGWGGIGMVVFDTLTKAMPGKDQNSVDDTSAVFEVTSMMREVNVEAAVLFVHHNNRGSNTPRGSSNIMAEPDTIMTGTRKEARVVNGVTCDIVELSVMMARSIDDDQKYDFALKSVELGLNFQGIMETAPVVVLLKDREAEDTVSEDKIKAALGGHKQAFYEAVVDQVTRQQGCSCFALHRDMQQHKDQAARSYYLQKMNGTKRSELITMWKMLVSPEEVANFAPGLTLVIDDAGLVGVEIEFSAAHTG